MSDSTDPLGHAIGGLAAILIDLVRAEVARQLDRNQLAAIAPIGPVAEAKAWLTVAEAAERALCAPSTLLRALRSGGIRGYQVAKGGIWRIHADDLEAWMLGEVPAERGIAVVTRRRSASTPRA